MTPSGNGDEPLKSIVSPGETLRDELKEMKDEEAEEGLSCRLNTRGLASAASALGPFFLSESRQKFDLQNSNFFYQRHQYDQSAPWTSTAVDLCLIRHRQLMP